MKDETIIILLGAAGIGLFALRKPLSDLTTPTGALIGTVNRGVSDIINTAEVGANGIISGSGKLVNSIIDRFEKSDATPQKVTTNPTVAVSRSNTVYTNPKSYVEKSYSNASAAQAIAVYQNPQIKNIATNLGKTTVYTQKAVSLPPSILSQLKI